MGERDGDRDREMGRDIGCSSIYLAIYPHTIAKRILMCEQKHLIYSRSFKKYQRNN